MAAANAQKFPAEAAAALPSMVLADLAAHWGYDEHVVNEYVQTGLLACHVLLHQVRVPIGRENKEDEWYDYDRRPSFVLDGYYRVRVGSAAAIVRSPRYEDVPAEIELREPIAGVTSTRLLLRRHLLRVLKEERERFEREVLGVAPKGATERPPTANALMRERCRTVAAMLWNTDAVLTIEDVIDEPRFQRFGIAEGTGVTRERYREWIKDLCPNRKPGRRPSRKTPA